MNQQNGDQINLKMAISALPYYIDRFNIYKVDLINFQKVQQALIWFVNDDQDEMFNYYDNRNIQRLDEVNVTNAMNDESIQKVLRHSNYLNQYFIWKDKEKEKRMSGRKSSSEFAFSGDEKRKEKKRNSNLLEVDGSTQPPLIMGAPEEENGKIAEQVKYNNLLMEQKE